jgi:hypothetical protein
LWIADSVTLSDGTLARNVAFEVNREAPFGTCPEESLIPPTQVVVVDGDEDASLLVQIDGGYALGGVTHVLYRLFRRDEAATFGATELGGGVAHWDPARQRIVVPSPQQPFPWGLDLDLGDAAWLTGDGQHAYVWGCSVPTTFLKQSCRLARLDAFDVPELFGVGGAWIPSVRAADGLVLFESGTWLSLVVPAPAGLRHAYIEDFGGELLSHVAPVATGPWSDGPSLGKCELPSGDPRAFCAGPVAHMDLADPSRPSEVPITYGIGTTGTSTGDPEDYWPRLVWVE